MSGTGTSSWSIASAAGSSPAWAGSSTSNADPVIKTNDIVAAVLSADPAFPFTIRSLGGAVAVMEAKADGPAGNGVTFELSGLSSLGDVTSLSGGAIVAATAIGQLAFVTQGGSTDIWVCSGLAPMKWVPISSLISHRPTSGKVRMFLDSSGRLSWENPADGTLIGRAQTALVSGSTLKSINSQTLLGSGNLVVTQAWSHGINDPMTVGRVPNAPGDLFVVTATGLAFISNGSTNSSNWFQLCRYDEAVRLAGAQTINGNKTGTGQWELSNQQPTTPSSAMNRELVDVSPMWTIGRIRRLGAYAFGNFGTGSSNGVAYGAGTAALNSGTANSGYARASLGRGLTTASGFSGAGIHFQRPMAIAVLLNVAAFPASNQTAIRLVVGGNGNVPATADANALTVHGYGVEIGWDASTTRAGIRLFAHNGTTYVTSPWWNNGWGNNHWLHLIAISDGAGNISLCMSNGGLSVSRPSTTPILTLAGGPTVMSTGQYVDLVAVNSTTGTQSVAVAVFDAAAEIK
ncbi:MAG: hypothetical protein EOP85_00330 [Verrucomicrobiaceae bacterium]|nr:MAG: hypothetical protein EOP85_00330 [Verrucomicrobiaceae bacterium]